MDAMVRRLFAPGQFSRRGERIRHLILARNGAPFTRNGGRSTGAMPRYFEKSCFKARLSTAGPDGGCYWPTEIEGSCEDFYWASSEEDATYAWNVQFNLGSVASYSKTYDSSVRCVR
jgi:hypothetical protein